MYRGVFVLLVLMLAGGAGCSSARSIGVDPGQSVPVADEIQKVLSTPNADNASFRFVVIGDSRAGDAVYQALLMQIREYAPRFVIHTGDMVNNGTAGEFEHYMGLIEGYEFPLLHIPGNHDMRTSADIYSAYFGDLNWSFDLGEYRFIGLDNTDYEFEPAMVAYAQERLDTDKTCFVSFHIPPVTENWDSHVMDADAGGPAGDKDYKSDEITSMLSLYSPALVFLGHIHLFDEEEIQGVEYLISGGGGSPLHDGYGYGTVEHGFVLVSVDQGDVEYEWVPLA